MILTFHKVSLISPTQWWISADEFIAILDELKYKKFVYLDEYDPDNQEHVVITFDGPYECLFEFAIDILHERSIPFELFIIGDYIGKNNDFDRIEPLTNFMSLEMLKRAITLGARLQWHTRSHQIKNPNDPIEVNYEFEPPNDLRLIFGQPHFNHIAYPHGRTSSTFKLIASKYFKSGLAVDDGDNRDKYDLKRITVLPNYRYEGKQKVSVIIPNYNYGHLIAMAIDSVLNQTIKADEIIVIDDCSNDKSMDVINSYSEYIKIIRNEVNMGIVETFNKAVNHANSDLIIILGADNYFHPDTLKDCQIEFEKDPKIGIVYYDFTIVGPLGHELAQKMGLVEHSYSKVDKSNLYISNFPIIQDTASYLKLDINYIHGSAMFRKECFVKVGGYKPIYPEDYYFWKSIIALDYKAIKLNFPYLYYRQHSPLQANNVLADRLKLWNYYDKVIKLQSNLEIISNQNEVYRNEINNLNSLNVLNLKFKTLIKVMMSRIYAKISKTLRN
jgi:glycosyltransferase involved in cell wall biosynthesis